MYQAQARDAYRDNQILTAPQNKLVLMLYDGAIRNIKLAKISLEKEDFKGVNDYLIKAQNIVLEFMMTLDFDAGGEVAENLYKMYDYIYRKLISANIEKDIDDMEEAEKYLEELRNTWAKI